MIYVLTETNVHLCFIIWTNSEALLVLTLGFPDCGTPGVPKNIRRKMCIDCVYSLCMNS